MQGSTHGAPAQAEAPDKGRIRLGHVGWAAAAALAILLVGELVRDAPPAQIDGAPVVREITTGGTEMVTVGLEDGSVVRIAPRSRLEFRRGADRQVWLEGRAFFSIATDTAHPFHVRTAGGDVAVLGTRFEVAARDRDVRVLVVEGKVELTTRGSRVELGARAVAEALAGGPAEVHEVEDVVPHLAWLGRTLVFQNTTFRDAAREMEDRFGIPLHFQAEAVAERRITAAFTDEDLDEVLRVICRAASARCTRSESSIVVAPRESTIEPGAADRFSPQVFPEERDP